MGHTPMEIVHAQFQFQRQHRHDNCHDDTHIMTRKDLNPRPCSTHVKSLTIVLILLYV